MGHQPNSDDDLQESISPFPLYAPVAVMLTSHVKPQECVYIHRVIKLTLIALPQQRHRPRGDTIPTIFRLSYAMEGK